MELALLLVPAVIAVLALLGAIKLIPDAESGREYIALRWTGVVLLFLVAFGIGTCYAMVFTSL